MNKKINFFGIICLMFGLITMLGCIVGTIKPLSFYEALGLWSCCFLGGFCSAYGIKI
jgi:hypothetical protein